MKNPISSTSNPSSNQHPEQQTQRSPAQTNAATRRSFVMGATALSLAAASGVSLEAAHAAPSKRILVGSHTPGGILAFAWDAATGTLTPEGVAAVVTNSTWLALSPDRRYLYVACELDEFQGKPTGAVASYSNVGGKLKLISQVDSHGKGTCHVTTDHTGYVVLAANYDGGAATAWTETAGNLAAPSWNEHYTGHGPQADRQEAAHAHFASLSPDNRYAYINDLGSDKIHIYKLDTATGKLGNLTTAGTYNAQPGDGPRTLHFHPNGKIAYCLNELNSTVQVLAWSAADGSLAPVQRVKLSPDPAKGPNTGCDIAITRDGLFAYCANRGDDFLASFHIDNSGGPATGKLTAFAENARVPSGGKTPRNFTLDPTERWMLIANQGSSNLTVLARDPKTGILSSQGKNTAAATPMCIVFV